MLIAIILINNLIITQLLKLQEQIAELVSLLLLLPTELPSIS